MAFASFFAGLAGLTANSRKLEVVGNNLANLNTIGFKSSRVTFNDVFAGFTGFDGVGNPQQIGRGTTIASVDNVFGQGSLSSTPLLTDLAVQGNGFFILGNPLGGQSYSRAGNFSFDQDGNLVAASGLRVQGFTQPDVNGNIPSSGTLNDITIPVGLQAPPQPTETFSARINLNADQVQDFETTITIYDSLGERHDLTLRFTPGAAVDEWDWQVLVPGDDILSGTPGVLSPIAGATGTFQFDPQGQLLSPATSPTITVPDWTNNAASQSMTFDLFDPSGQGLITRFAAPSAISSANQDGFGVGSLNTLLIEQDGLVSGIFTNGVNIELARIALATFNNDNGLLRNGQNTYSETNASGIATIGSANSGGRGIVVSNSLELSNVDITKEFTDLIISQRGYQANSRIITTTDEIIQEALTLKR